MAHSAVTQLNEVLSGIREAEAAHDRAAGSVCLVAVSKTFEAEHIRPVLDAGQRVFGENRVQEAMGKWPQLRTEYDGIELHLIGPLQSNKAKEAVATFDVIHSIDREKIARALKGEMAAQGRDLPCFIQVNTGEEPQKAGIAPKETDDFIRLCREEIGLNVIGLMCIPPWTKRLAPISRSWKRSPAATALRSFPWACRPTSRLLFPSARPMCVSARPSLAEGPDLPVSAPEDAASCINSAASDGSLYESSSDPV